MSKTRAAATIEIRRAEEPTDDVRTLIAELDNELAAHYEAEQRHGLTVDAIFQPEVRFFVAYMNGKPAGCGGVALLDDYAEVKRMYVRPSARGSGVADEVLTRIEAEAARAGRAQLRLETGTHQAAAVRFYERHGFTRCDAFGAYIDMPTASTATSVFMEKRIAAT